MYILGLRPRRLYTPVHCFESRTGFWFGIVWHRYGTLHSPSGSLTLEPSSRKVGSSASILPASRQVFRPSLVNPLVRTPPSSRRPQPPPYQSSWLRIYMLRPPLRYASPGLYESSRTSPPSPRSLQTEGSVARDDKTELGRDEPKVRTDKASVSEPVSDGQSEHEGSRRPEGARYERTKEPIPE